MSDTSVPQIELIPIDRVSILNPRARNKKIFREIVSSIQEVGLKRPITVTRRDGAEGPGFELVCGQGRLEAFLELGQSEIPAIIIEADTQTSLVKSLVENCARRQHQAIDLVRDIEGMKVRGYSEVEIGRKTGLSVEYVKGIGKLLQQGEQRLLRSVEAGHIPISVAVEIADADDDGIQNALQNAYEKNILRGRKLLIAKKVVESRHRRGKGMLGSNKKKKDVTSETLVRAYQEDTDRKKLLIRKADATRNRLIFIAHAIRELLLDEEFVEVLKMEKLDTVPKKLAARMERQGLTR
ncbi:ParB/RepB/Spo0J family partition protein [Roseibium sp. SCP14]|uniref:ParB/RepB/Spo0J family partition protein n=1 Tax=Roseibium sp. SCP14 TaxID=3141375 RepID=UPI00333D097E